MKTAEDGETVYLDFSQQRAAARSADGWLQGRYYSAEGLSVSEYLSFNEVFGICPFEVGVRRAAERRAHRAMLAKLTRILELSDLLPRAFQTLSNGEMRRVLFARALLRRPAKLVLDDPMAGLDPVHRARFRRIIALLSRDGVDIRLRCRYRDERPVDEDEASAGRGRSSVAPRPAGRPNASAKPVFELSRIAVSFGRRRLFRDFSWSVREGERWVLKGRNGSGKTTLLALITGDCPLAYANDVTVFGEKRGEGELASIRRRIGRVSPEMQTYGDKGPEELLDDALRGNPGLLLLDEPCLNLDAAASKRLLRRVAAWLKRHPATAAVCVAHRPDHVPPGFDLEMDLDRVASGGRRGAGK